MSKPKALKSLQTLGSVGPKMAVKIYELGYPTIQSLQKANPTKMYQDYSAKMGGYADPCVEDVFRCAVAQAIKSDLPQHAKDWWYWSEQRGKPLSFEQV
jgi:hypothetical protein